MKFITTKHFKFQISQLSIEERSVFIDYIIEAASWNIPSSPDRFIQSIINEHIIPYIEHKNKVSEVRRTVWQSANLPYKSEPKSKPIKESTKQIQHTWTEKEIEDWFDLPEEAQIKYRRWKYLVNKKPEPIIEEEVEILIEEETSKSRFPRSPYIDELFPTPDLATLWDAPEDYSPSTPWFWDIFLTLDKNALNNLPFSWYEIATDIQERMTQIDRIKDAIPILTTSK